MVARLQRKEPGGRSVERVAGIMLQEAGRRPRGAAQPSGRTSHERDHERSGEDLETRPPEGGRRPGCGRPPPGPVGVARGRAGGAAQARLPGPPDRHRRRLRSLVRAHDDGGGEAHQREGRHRRTARGDRRGGRRDGPEARRRGGREVRDPAQGGLHLRHPLLARRHRLGPAGGGAEDPVPGRERGLSRRLRRAEPLRVPARASPTCGRRSRPWPGGSSRTSARRSR